MGVTGSVLVFMSVALMTLAYYTRRPAIAIGAGLAWLIFGVYNYTLFLVEWDINYVLFIFGVIMFFTCLIEGFVLKPKPENQEMEEDDWDKELEELHARKQREEDAKRGIRIVRRNEDIDEIKSKGYK